MAPDLSFLLSAGGYFKKNLHFFSITNCNCFKVCLEEFQISFSFICTHIEIKYFNEASLVNLQYFCFLYYPLAKKMLFMENLAKNTTLNYCGSFCQCISLSFRRKKKKKRKMQFTSLGLSVLGKTVLSVLSTALSCIIQDLGHSFSQFLQTSHLANNIYLLYKLLCCARMSNPKNSHNSTLVKLLYFFYMFNITNQLLTHQSFFMPICKVDK